METTSKTASVSITDGWRGLAFSADGTRLYAGNGAHASITEFAVNGNHLTVYRKIDLFPGEPLHTVHLIADILPYNHALLVLDTLQDSVFQVDPALDKVTRTIPVAHNPYAMLMAPDGKSVYVSSWTTATVVQYALPDGRELLRLPVGEHPTEMVWLPHNRLAVACANSNFVFILGQDRQGRWQTQEKLNLALTPRQPVGMTPSSLSLSADRRTLYIACSDANAVAVVDVSDKESKVIGYIPTGWYPTTVRALRDGRVSGVQAIGVDEIQLSLVYVNTLMIEQVLAESAWQSRLNANDRKGITPLIYGHVNPYGSFQLDLNSRLPIDPPRLGPHSVGTQLLLRYDDQQTG